MAKVMYRIEIFRPSNSEWVEYWKDFNGKKGLVEAAKIVRDKSIYPSSRLRIVRVTMDIVMPEEYEKYLSCPKGGEHEWGTDGMHQNEFCKKCFMNSPSEEDRTEGE